MATAVPIDAARPEDLPGVLDLLRRAQLPVDELDRHLATTLVARCNGSIVGSAALELYGPGALLRSVAVDTTFQGQAVGARLTDAALALARANHVKTVYLLTTTAAEFFPRFGFRPIPRSEVETAVQQSVEFTSACPSTALVMARRL